MVFIFFNPSFIDTTFQVKYLINDWTCDGEWLVYIDWQKLCRCNFYLLVDLELSKIQICIWFSLLFWVLVLLTRFQVKHLMVGHVLDGGLFFIAHINSVRQFSNNSFFFSMQTTQYFFSIPPHCHSFQIIFQLLQSSFFSFAPPCFHPGWLLPVSLREIGRLN